MKQPRLHQLEALTAMNNVNEGIIHLPTGTGKTFIQALSIYKSLGDAFKWVHENYTNEDIPVYVILSPRIILSNQLYSEVKSILTENNKDCQYLIVHSGHTSDTNVWGNLPYRKVESTTSSYVIRKEYEKAVTEQVPLIIFGTYDSAERIVQARIPVYMMLGDEGQYLVSNDFGWIPKENEVDNVKQFNAHRKYYFTATLKTTSSNEGYGMNNEKLFGPIIYSKTPLEMIQRGEIVRPRMHIVNVKQEEEASIEDMDANAVRDSFIEHKAVQQNIGAKLLVVTQGSEALDRIVKHPIIKQLLKTRPSLKIFDITSAFGARVYDYNNIDGSQITRDEFLSQIQNMDDTQDAIIFHINILSEGIDVPGITGVMIMNNMKLSKFLQTLGRATRLHKIDREHLYNNVIKPDDLKQFIKPYAWIIIPIYDEIGHDLRDSIKDIVWSLRDYGFNAAEDVVIKKSKGSSIPEPIDELNEVDRRATIYHEILLDVEHEIESEDEANNLSRVTEYLKELNIDEEIEEELKKYL